MTGSIPNASALKRMKTEILALVSRKGGGVSFVELCEIDGFRGERAAWHPNDINVLLWNDISQVAVDAMTALLEQGLIEGHSTSILVYLVDGIFINLPIAKQLKKPYKEPHWWPVTFSLGRAPHGCS